jgi:hypothetical protein
VQRELQPAGPLAAPQLHFGQGELVCEQIFAITQLAMDERAQVSQ